jgi:hypothetical protein
VAAPWPATERPRLGQRSSSSPTDRNLGPRRVGGVADASCSGERRNGRVRDLRGVSSDRRRHERVGGVRLRCRHLHGSRLDGRQVAVPRHDDDGCLELSRRCTCPRPAELRAVLNQVVSQPGRERPRHLA